MENTDVKKFQPSAKTKVINGSILNPHNAGLCFILSVANLAGKPESPLFPIFDKKWKKVKEETRGWFTNKTGAYKYGAVNTTAVQSNVWVISMLCQDDQFKTDEKGLEDCLKSVVKLAKTEKATLHISNLLVNVLPASFEKLIDTHFVQNGISVYFYNEPA